MNIGTGYSGTTVYLESDLDFSGGLSEQFEPMGSYRIPFDGIFDGQGHTISNLVIKSSFSEVGVFGYSTGAIKNLVMDSSCSVTSTFTGNAYIRVGSLIGFVDLRESGLISNIVNMADVTFEGSTTGDEGFLYLGGIAGFNPSALSPKVAEKN